MRLRIGGGRVLPYCSQVLQFQHDIALYGNGYDYARDAFNPIEADLLIVDEVSMVDIPLAWHLFQAVNLKKTTVVLAGDHNQLPPVGPGNVLRDLVLSKAIPTTVLSKIIRQAGVLKENSTAILNGEIRGTSEEKIGQYRPWYVVDQFSDRHNVQMFLETLFTEVHWGEKSGPFTAKLLERIMADKQHPEAGYWATTSATVRTRCFRSSAGRFLRGLFFGAVGGSERNLLTGRELRAPWRGDCGNERDSLRRCTSERAEWFVLLLWR